MEHRICVRRAAIIPAALRARPDKRFDVLIRNWSPEGAFVRGADLPHAAGEIVVLVLDQPNSTDAAREIPALVVREQPGGLGLWFLDESLRVQTLLTPIEHRAGHADERGARAPGHSGRG